VPLFYQQNINASTKLAIWKIEEEESFFLEYVPLKKDIIHPHKRLQHLAGRYLLRYLFPDFPNHEILIADTRKPFLPNEQYHFSISHCGDYAAAIVSANKRVGIDIEIPTNRVLKIAHKFLNNGEKKIIDEQHANFKDQYSLTEYQLPTVFWSAKEAIFKWWGRGEVDFKEMIQIDQFSYSEQGNMNASFMKEDAAPYELQLYFQQFEDLCLVWLMSDVDHLFV
jgi:phosphopantetheinyl transferase